MCIRHRGRTWVSSGARKSSKKWNRVSSSQLMLLVTWKPKAIPWQPQPEEAVHHRLTGYSFEIQLPLLVTVPRRLKGYGSFMALFTLFLWLWKRLVTCGEHRAEQIQVGSRAALLLLGESWGDNSCTFPDGSVNRRVWLIVLPQDLPNQPCFQKLKSLKVKCAKRSSRTLWAFPLQWKACMSSLAPWGGC